MPVLHNLKPGQRVYMTMRRRRGNTLMTETAIFDVLIKEVDLERRRVFASWNYNPPRWWPERTAVRWKLKRPEKKKI